MAKKEAKTKIEESDKTLPVLTHILTLVAGFIAPLIILLVSKDENAKKHSKNALNWQFSLMIYLLISFVLMLILIGFLLFFALIILNLVFAIMAAVKAGNNELWKYPLAIHFFKT